MKPTAQSINELFKQINSQLSEYEQNISQIESECEAKYTKLKHNFDKAEYDSLYSKGNELELDLQTLKNIPICSEALIEKVNTVIGKINNYTHEIRIIERNRRLKPLLLQWRDKTTGDRVYRKLKDYKIDESSYSEALHCYRIYHNDELVRTTPKKNRFGKVEYFIEINGNEFQVKKIVAQHFNIPNDDIENKTFLYYKKDVNNNRFNNLEYDYPKRWEFRK